MKAAKLVRFGPCTDVYVPNWDEKWEFTFDNDKTIVLLETWHEVLIGQPLESVERWLIKRYGFALDFLGARSDERVAS